MSIQTDSLAAPLRPREALDVGAARMAPAQLLLLAPIGLNMPSPALCHNR